MLFAICDSFLEISKDKEMKNFFVTIHGSKL